YSATAASYTLSLHDALPISELGFGGSGPCAPVNPFQLLAIQGFFLPQRSGLHSLFFRLQFQIFTVVGGIGGQNTVVQLHHAVTRSEEHTSELQSRFDLVCRL